MKVFHVSIFVASTACGVAVIRSNWEDTVGRWFGGRPQPWSPTKIIDCISDLSRLWVPLLFCWSLAVVGEAFMPARRSLREFLSRPGSLACVTGAIYVARNLLGVIIAMGSAFLLSATEPKMWAMYQVVMRGEWISDVFCEPAVVGVPGPSTSIATLWIFLAAFRVRQAGGGWLETAGRAIGVMWIAIGLTRYTAFIFERVGLWKHAIAAALGGMS